jgi:poly(3-hydroxyalkanoate) synthetase
LSKEFQMDNFSRPASCGENPVRGASLRGASPSEWLTQFQHCLTNPARAPTRFASENRIVETYGQMRLRAFGKRQAGATPTLIVPPLAVQDAGFIDLMRGHSLVQTLCAANAGQVYVTDWMSATPDMGPLSIDSCLAELNIAIDDLGGEVNIVGLGVGGCLALVHAARFPGKIKRLVLAGAPVDVDVRASLMTRYARSAIECAELPDDASVGGAQSLGPLGAPQAHECAALDTLQRNAGSFARADLDAITTYKAWAARSIDVPGRYARELLTRIFAGNQLATGGFIALGRKIDLRDVKIPLFVLAGARDEITPKQQALSALQLVGTAKARMRSLVAPCGHFALFVGAGTLSREWRTIAGWLTSSAPLSRKPALTPSRAAFPASDHIRSAAP